MVGGQLHDEGGGVARKGLGLFQHDAGADDGCHADEVGRHCHQRRAAEHCTGDQADDGHLCAAGDEAGGHDGHAAVTLVLDGTACHNARHAAAGAHQHRDKALAGKAELAEDTVHDKGHAGHIAHVLQNGQQEEQHQHLGHKAQHRAHTGHDAVHDQAVQPACHADALQKAAQRIGNDLTEQHIVGPVGGKGAQRPAAVRDGGAHGQGVHQVHHHCKDGQCQHAVGNDPVDLIGNGQVLHAGLLLDSLAHHGVDVGIALVGDDALGVIVHLFFAVLNVLVDVVHQCLVEPQLFQHLLVPLEELDGVPAQEAVIHLALNALLNVGNGVLHTAGEHMGQLAGLAGLGSGDRSLGGGLGALALQCADLHCLTAQLCAQLLQVDGVAVLAHQIDHVHSHHHRDAQLDQLGGQVEVALDVGAVDDVQDGVGLLLHKVSTGDNFFQRVGGQRVDAGQILNDNVLVTLEFAFLFFHSNAGPVAHILVGAGQVVEQGRFAAVRVAGQCNFNAHCGYLSSLWSYQTTSIISASALRTLSS